MWPSLVAVDLDDFEDACFFNCVLLLCFHLRSISSVAVRFGDGYSLLELRSRTFLL